MKYQSSSRAGRLSPLALVVALIAVALFLFTRQQEDPTVSAQSLTVTAPVAATAVPTTLPVAMPVAAADVGGHATTLASLERLDVPGESVEPAVVPLASVEASHDEPEDDEQSSAVEAQAASRSTASAPAAASQPSAPPSSQDEAASPPEATATAVPNPQPATTAVPNPQPAAAAAPIPQAAAPVGAVPADAPAGGTFTHTLTATTSRPTLHTAPGGPVFTPSFNGTALPAVNPTVFGNALVYRVLAGEPGDAWAKVYVPARPNGTTAWVQTSQFNWGSSNRMLQINVSNNTVTVFEGANVLLTTSAVTGKSSSPTPLASGWVEEIMAGPSAAYGTKLISLGMFSDALNSFGGGIPKIALHGTNNPGLMGQYASNGCIRVPNEIINQIASIMPVGSKVVIVG